MLKKGYIIAVLVFLSCVQTLQATHIVGGAFDYQKIADSTYVITLKLYRDCRVDSVNSPIPLPTVANIKIRGFLGADVGKDIQIPRISIGEVDPVVDTCVVQPNICVQEGIYRDTIYGIDPRQGHHVYYQLCCRNSTILNVVNPLDAGESFYTYISPDTLFYPKVSERLIWFENFDLADSLDSDNGSTAWSTTSSSGSNVFGGTLDGKFCVSDADGPYTLTTEYVDISAHSSVDLQVTLFEEGGLESSDQIEVFYNLNGLDGVDYPFDVNDFVQDDFTPGLTAYADNVSGLSVRVKVVIENNSPLEMHCIDNIKIISPDTASYALGDNSSPAFVNTPPIFVCLQETLEFDNSAIDADGDSLVYSFYTPYDARNPADADFEDYIPTYSVDDQIIFDTIPWVTGFDANNPLGPSGISLNANTGLLTISPPNLGQYVVGVRVDEYRDGRLIGYTVRDFQFNVVYCPPIAEAMINDSTSCANRATIFLESEDAAKNYWWDFGDPTTNADTSIIKSPTYAYDAGGNYTVTLITNPNTACADTMTKNLAIKSIDADFGFGSSFCQNETVLFKDSTVVSSNNAIVSWTWDFGNGSTSTQQNPSSTYTTVGTYQIKLVVEDQEGCKDSITKSIVVTPRPILTAANDFNACVNENKITLSATAQHYVSIDWNLIGPGYGVFVSENNLSTDFTLSPLNNTFNVSSLKFEVIATGSCATVRDTIEVTLKKAPRLDLFGDTTMCYGADSILIALSPSGGTLPYQYNWSNNITSISQYVDVGSYVGWVEDANGCLSPKDSIVIDQVQNQTTVQIHADSIVCLNNAPFDIHASYAHTDGITWSAAGTIAPSSTDSVITYNPTAAERAALSFSIRIQTDQDALGCPTAKDTAEIQINRLIVLNKDSIIPPCYDNDGLAYVQVSGGTNPYLYQWGSSSNNQIGDTAFNLSASWHYVTVTDTIGCSVVDSFDLRNNPLVLDITDTSDVTCFDQATGSATLGISEGVAPYSILWDSLAGSQTTATATNLTPGTYTVTGVDAINCKVDISVPIQNLAPSAVALNSLGSDTLCAGNSFNLSTGASGGYGPPYTYNWSTGSSNTSFTVSPADDMLYTVSATDKEGCPSEIDSLHIGVNTMVLTKDSIIPDCDSTNGVASVSLIDGTMPFTYQWGASSNNQATDTVYNLAPVMHYVTITDAIGCQTSASFNLDNDQPDLALIDTTHVDCYGQPEGEATVLASGGTAPYAYQWDSLANYQTTPTAVLLQADIYTVSATDATGCTVSLEVEIEDRSEGEIFVTLSEPDTVCPNTQITLNASASGGAGGPYSFDWNNGFGSGNSITVTLVSDMTYNVIATDSKGCKSLGDSVIMRVHLFNPDSLLLNTQDVCQFSESFISASYQGDLGPYTYTWDNGLNGSGPHQIIVSDTQNYSVTVTDVCGNQVSNSLSVYPLDVPEIADYINMDGCEPFSFSISDSLNNSNIVEYLWDLGDGTTSSLSEVSHTYQNPGIYSVKLQMINTLGCTSNFDTASIVNVFSLPIVICGASDTEIEFGEPAQFSSSTQTTYNWDLGDPLSIEDTSTQKAVTYFYSDTGTYTASVIVSNQYGCIDSCFVTIRVSPDISIKVPNVFIPDPTGPNGGDYDPDNPNNQVFFPFTEYVDKFHMMIFNRWGEMIFETYDINKGWDGYYKGKLCQQDAYVWKIEATFFDGREKSLTGDVTLLR